MDIDWENPDLPTVKYFIDTYADMNEDELLNSLAIAVQNVESKNSDLVCGPDWRANREALLNTVAKQLEGLKEKLCTQLKDHSDAVKTLDSNSKEFPLWLATLANQIRVTIKDAPIEPFASAAESTIPGIAALLLVMRAGGKAVSVMIKKLCETEEVGISNTAKVEQ